MKLLVVACNSATAAALPALRERLRQTTLGVDVLGVVQPGAVQAVAATRNGRVGLLATPATVESGSYARAIADADPFVQLTSVACPDLAAIIEAGFPFDEHVVDTVRAVLRAAARGRRGHRRARLHALPARAADAPAHARPAREHHRLRRPARPPGRARARRARAGEPARRRAGRARSAARRQPRRGPLLVPVHRRHAGVPRPRHALPAAAARRGRAGRARRRRRSSRERGREPGAQRRPRTGRAAADHDRAGLRAHRHRLGADLVRRDARDLHRVRAGLGAALDGRQGPRLGDGRVRDAPGLDRRPQAARRHQGPPRRAHRRDPAPDRPFAARRSSTSRRSASARSTSTATSCRPTAGRAAPRSPAATSRSSSPAASSSRTGCSSARRSPGPSRRCPAG